MTAGYQVITAVADAVPHQHGDAFREVDSAGEAGGRDGEGDGEGSHAKGVAGAEGPVARDEGRHHGGVLPARGGG